MDATYTAEQLRRDAIAIERMHGETLTVEWRGHQASQLRAHADALDTIAKLKAHAEAMCRILQMGDGGFDRPETAAYRAAYPKED